MKKVIISGIVVIAAIAGFAYMLNKNKAKNEEQIAVVAQKNSAVSVRADKATSRELSTAYIVNGTFAPKQEVMIAAESAGRIVKVLVQEGSFVSAGQVLAIVESEKQNVSVTNAQAVYNNALAEVQRFENAFQSGGVTAQQLAQVKLQLENAKNNLKSAQIMEGDANIRASFPGIVNKRNVEPGAYVNPGTQLFDIVNVSTLKLQVNVDEKHIGNIKLGQQVKVTAQAIADQSWMGTITFIAPKADASLNFPVEIEIKNNSANDLRAGMYGSAIFGSEAKQSVFSVPRNAFVGNISSNEIFVIKDGKAVLTKVASGKNFGDFIEIVSGLNNEDVVITSGQINIIDGSPVEIIK